MKTEQWQQLNHLLVWSLIRKMPQSLIMMLTQTCFIFKNPPAVIDFFRLEEEDDVLLLDHVKKLEREKRLGSIVDRNLTRNYNSQEVEMMIKVALLCTQPSPEDRPTMSDVVRMLEGEGLAERWEEWQQVEINRRQEYERLQMRFDWGEDSVHDQNAIELSGGR